MQFNGIIRCIYLCMIYDSAGQVNESSLPGCGAAIRRVFTPAGRSWKTGDATIQSICVERGGVQKYGGCQGERWGNAPSIPISDDIDAAPASTIPAQTSYA